MVSTCVNCPKIVSVAFVDIILTIMLEADFGMLRRDFRDLLDKTGRAVVQNFAFVEEVAMVSSVLGEVVGKTFPTEFTHVSFKDATSCMAAIGKKVGLQAKKANACSANSSLFFETLLTGVFGVKDTSTFHVKSLKEILVAKLVNLWQNRAFRSVAKTLPELSTYCLSEVRFALPNLVQDWLRGAGTVHPVTPLMLDVLSHAFDCQFGLVTLCSPGDAFLFLHGKAAARRVYIGTNGMSGTQQKFFYFCRTSSKSQQ